jgi:hypothetical protein
MEQDSVVTERTREKQKMAGTEFPSLVPTFEESNGAAHERVSQGSAYARQSRNLICERAEPYPKQIINDLHYFGPLLWSNDSSYQDLERELRNFFGGGVYVFAIGKARAGIYVLVKTGIQKNRIPVILSPYTIPDVVQMVRFAGGEPVLWTICRIQQTLILSTYHVCSRTPLAY